MSTSPAEVARSAFGAALEAVAPGPLVHRVWPEAFAQRKATVLAVGKAALPMAAAVAERTDILAGLVTVPQGYRASWQGADLGIPVWEAGHPVPTAASERAGRQALTLASACDDLLVLLLSGGGSALWTVPADGLTLADLQATGRLLLESGLPITAVNAVRKHLSALKGGRLAQAARSADVLVLGLSDVPGDRWDTLASGPAALDPTTYADATEALRTAGCWDKLPPAVRTHLSAGERGELSETAADPKAFSHVQATMVGTNATAVEAAAGHLRAAGYRPVLRYEVEGEAAEVGADLGRAARAASPGTAFVWGGETTVTVRGRGRGGRSQEAALAAAAEISGAPHPIAVLCAGTDGIDGPTDAAGACMGTHTAGHIAALGTSIPAVLAANDAYPWLERIDALIRTGPTHTNVRDVMIAVVS